MIALNGMIQRRDGEILELTLKTRDKGALNNTNTRQSKKLGSLEAFAYFFLRKPKLVEKMLYQYHYSQKSSNLFSPYFCTRNLPINIYSRCTNK